MALPRIAALGDFESAEGAVLPEDGGDFGPPEAVGELRRRMALAALIRGWATALKAAAEDGNTALIGSSPAQVFALAGDLGELIDEMTIEGVDWRALDKLVPDEFDRYWELTLRFLRIAAEAWPQWLAEHGLIDRVARGAKLIEAEIARLEAPGAGPVIVAGSTGTNRATARLMAAVARAAQGAVVLPDFHREIDDASVAQILAGDKAAASAAGHPQAALLRLLAAMGVRRDQVKPLEAGLRAAPPDARKASQRSHAAVGNHGLLAAQARSAERRSDGRRPCRRRHDRRAKRSRRIPRHRRRVARGARDARQDRRAGDAGRQPVAPRGGGSQAFRRRPSRTPRARCSSLRRSRSSRVSRSPPQSAARPAIARRCLAMPLFCPPSAAAFDGARRVLDLAVLRRPEAAVKDALDAEELERARAAALGDRRRPWLARLSEEDWRAAASLGGASAASV